MQAALPDLSRLQPTTDSLNIILKNTHFKDNILAPDSKIQFRIDYTTKIPVLILKFPEPYYDFVQVLNQGKLVGSNQEWLNKNPVVIKLVISDAIITDHLSTLSFYLDFVESEELRTNLMMQKELSIAQINDIEEYIHSNINKFLL